MTVQFQKLFEVCKANESPMLDGFHMGKVCEATDCGTVGCMIGNFNAMFGRKYNRLPTHFYDHNGDHYVVHDWLFFGISKNEYDWLFAEGPSKIDPSAYTRKYYNTNYGKEIHLDLVSQKEALQRLYKFIYYKLHKHEMCYDEKYGVREQARRQEGNYDFVSRTRKRLQEHYRSVV